MTSAYLIRIQLVVNKSDVDYCAVEEIRPVKLSGDRKEFNSFSVLNYLID
jgi:hypothetical protein